MRAQPVSEVPLTKPLWEWKKEIEARGKGELVLARAFTDPKQNTISLPDDVKHREVLKHYFMDESFVARLFRSHAVDVNDVGPGGRFFFVVLNMALAPQWQGHEDAVIAHEFGHIDLLTRSYANFQPASTGNACDASQASDIVQHVLIREEIRRRGIDYNEYWIRNLNGALDAMDLELSGAAPAPAPPDHCLQAARLTLWLDVRLGLTPKLWTRYAHFDEVMRKRSPELKTVADEIEKRLREAALWTTERYLDALYFVFQRLQALPIGPA